MAHRNHAAALSLVVVLFGLWACTPPEGPAPRSAGGPGDATSPAAPDPVVPTFTALALPDDLPAPVYSRTAPTSLVDEHGAPQQVLSGHHTLLELRHVQKDRALVACRVCVPPIEGWVQVSMLMPIDHQPEATEVGDETLALATYASSLRRGLVQTGTFPGVEPSDDERALLLRLLDQGFAREGDLAMAPASGAAYARERAAIHLKLGPAGWALDRVEWPTSSDPAPVH